jgi:hypothetical protein
VVCYLFSLFLFRHILYPIHREGTRKRTTTHVGPGVGKHDTRLLLGVGAGARHRLVSSSLSPDLSI